MPKIPALSDTQSILLTTAARRERGSLLPLPETITAPAGGIAKSLASLLNRGLAEERAVEDAALAHRSDHDVRYGLFLTPAGEAAIGLGKGADGEGTPLPGPDSALADAQTVPAAPASPASSRAPRAGTKAELVLALLRRPEGATLADIIAATDWLPHTTRAALTGMRKKGHAIERTSREGVTCYRVREEGAA